MPSLEEGRAEMHVEYMKRVLVYLDIGAKASARLASANAEVIIESPLNGQARKQDVSVRAASQ
jgi:hypothetical protein